MFSDILPPLANLSRAFQRKNIDFSMIKPLVQGTMATIESLLMTSDQHFSSLSTVLPDLRQYGFKQPSSAEEDAFQQQVYNRYLSILLDHISGRFPDAALIEAFSVFDPAKIPLNFSVQDAASHGVDALTRLTEYCS